jgi:cell wall-associated NlpC family hydrolase
MSEPLPGDFMVARTRFAPLQAQLMSACIQWGTNSDVNHAGIHVGDGQVIEARPGGAGYAPLTEYMGDNTRWSAGYGITSGLQRAAIVAAAEHLIGTPYGWGDCVAIALAQARLGGHVDAHADWTHQPWWVKRLARTDRLICSQLVDQAYLLAGVHLFSDGRYPGMVSPADLQALMT